jgi:hypothetical protein
LGGLWSDPGRGEKPKWQEADIAYLVLTILSEKRILPAIPTRLTSVKGNLLKSVPDNRLINGISGIVSNVEKVFNLLFPVGIVGSGNV